MLVNLEKGDRVGYTPFGQGAKNMIGTIMEVNREADGSVTYDVMWDGLDWMTEGWRLEQFEEESADELPF